MSDASNPYAPPAQEEAAAIDPATERIAQLNLAAAELLQQGRRGANWFYWIAAFSIVNVLIGMAGGDVHFVIGLAVAEIIGGIAAAIAGETPEAANVILGVGFAMCVMLAGVVALFGWMSNKRWLPVFALGMVLYGLDAGLFLLVGDLMSVGFHAFGLWCMWSGFAAYRKYNAFQLAVSEELAAQGV